MISYDDFWALPCTMGASLGASPPSLGAADSLAALAALGGEALAHVEIAARYGVQFECACGPCSAGYGPHGWRVHFVVRAIGTSHAAHGFGMRANEVSDFLEANRFCRLQRSHQAHRIKSS